MDKTTLTGSKEEPSAWKNKANLLRNYIRIIELSEKNEKEFFLYNRDLFRAILGVAEYELKNFYENIIHFYNNNHTTPNYWGANCFKFPILKQGEYLKIERYVHDIEKILKNPFVFFFMKKMSMKIFELLSKNIKILYDISKLSHRGEYLKDDNLANDFSTVINNSKINSFREMLNCFSSIFLFTKFFHSCLEYSKRQFLYYAWAITNTLLNGSIGIEKIDSRFTEYFQSNPTFNNKTKFSDSLKKAMGEDLNIIDIALENKNPNFSILNNALRGGWKNFLAEIKKQLENKSVQSSLSKKEQFLDNFKWVNEDKILNYESRLSYNLFLEEKFSKNKFFILRKIEKKYGPYTSLENIIGKKSFFK